MAFIKGIIIRWAVKQIKNNVNGDMTYAQLGYYGIEDIIDVGDEKGYIL